VRVIIAGSRSITDYAIVEKAVIVSKLSPTLILSGAARGVDQLAIRYADRNGLPVELYPAEWEKHGKRAGYIRNEQMAKHATALIAIWDGQSRGTWHMINIAKAKNLPTYIHRVNQP